MSKLIRVYGECLGARSRRRTRLAAISLGEPSNRLRSEDVRMGKPGWGNAQSLRSEYIGPAEATGGIETSQYPEEEKETSTPLVAASETGSAQTYAV